MTRSTERIIITIKDGDEILFENINALITKVTSSEGLHSWHGSITLPHTPNAYHVKTGKEFHLETQDGQSAEIKILIADITERFGARVTFRLMSDLKAKGTGS